MALPDRKRGGRQWRLMVVKGLILAYILSRATKEKVTPNQKNQESK